MCRGRSSTCIHKHLEKPGWDSVCGCVLVRHAKQSFQAAVDLVCAGVCHFKIQHWLVWHQLVLWTELHTVAACVRSVWQSHNSCVADSTKLRRSCVCVHMYTWCALNSQSDYDLVTHQQRDSEVHLLRTRPHLAPVIRTIWTVNTALLSPVERLSHSMLHLPLMDSRCPTGFWTLSAWDVPNVHQLPGKPFRAVHQRQAQMRKNKHFKVKNTPLHGEIRWKAQKKAIQNNAFTRRSPHYTIYVITVILHE